MPTYDKDALKGLRPKERHWVLCRLAGESEAQASLSVGLSVVGHYGWANLARARELVDQLFEAPMDAAIARLFDAGVKAAEVMIRGLDSKNERIAQAAARDIMDRLAGKPTVYLSTTSNTEEVDRYLSNLKRMGNVLMGTSTEGQGGTLGHSELPTLDAPSCVPQLNSATEVVGGWRAGGQEQVERDGDDAVDIPESEGPLLDSGA